MSDALFAELITWDAPSSGARWVDIKDALVAAGLSESFAPELSPRQLFSRATRELKEGRTIDRVKDSGDVLWQFTQLEYKGESIEFKPEYTVKLKGPVAECEADPQFGQLVTGLMGAVQEVRTGADVSKVVARVYDQHTAMFPIVPKKGVVYVVPIEYQSLNAQVEQVLAACGGKLHRFPIPKGDEKGKASVRDAIDAGLNSILAEIEAGVEDWDEKTRKGTFDRAFESVDMVSLKVEHYASYLEGRKADLEAALAQAKKKIGERIANLAGGEKTPAKSSGAAEAGLADGLVERKSGGAAGGAPVSFASAAHAPSR